MVFNGFGNYIQDGLTGTLDNEGLDPLSINLGQKYIQVFVLARANARLLRFSVFTEMPVIFHIVFEKLRYGNENLLLFQT